MVRINFNDLAREITLKEGLIHSLKIGDVKEVMKLFCFELNHWDDSVIVKEIRRIANLKRRE